MVRHAKVTLDEVLNHRCVQASRGISRLLGARFDPLGERLALGFGEFAGAPWRSLVYQAGQALEEILMAVIRDYSIFAGFWYGSRGAFIL